MSNMDNKPQFEEEEVNSPEVEHIHQQVEGCKDTLNSLTFSPNGLQVMNQKQE